MKTKLPHLHIIPLETESYFPPPSGDGGMIHSRRRLPVPKLLLLALFAGRIRWFIFKGNAFWSPAAVGAAAGND